MKQKTQYFTLIGFQITVAIILLALFLSLYKYTERLLINQCDEKAFRDLERMELSIQREMFKAESATHALSSLVFKDGVDIPTDSSLIYKALEQFLDGMPPSITGAVIGFEDGVLPQYEGEWGFLPLIRHVDDHYVHYQLGTIRDVRAIHDWYRETKRLDTERWGQPQLSEEGEVICGYCLPLHDKEGMFVGVLEVDFSIDRLAKEVCAIRSYPNAEPMVVDKNLTILMSPFQQNVLKETMPSLLAKRGLQMDAEIKKNVAKGIRKRYHIIQGGFNDRHEVFFFHSPEPHTGWTLQMTCPASDVINDLQALKNRMTIIAFTIIILLVLVALTSLRKVEN